MASSQQELLPPPEDIDDTHKVYSIAVCCIVLGIVTSLFVLARVGLRFHARAFGADDYAIIPALLLYVCWTIMAAYVNLHAGIGKPLWEITLGEYSIWFKGIVGSAWLYPATTCCIRISILLFYYRVFALTKTRVKYTIWFLLALQGVYLVVFSILPAIICRPLYKAWNPLERPLYCNDWSYYYTHVALYSTSMAFDAILLVFPLYPVFQLRMPIKRRAGVAILFMLGATASVAAAYKLAIFALEMERHSAIDPRWFRYKMSRLIPHQFDQFGTTFWMPSQVEPTVALIGTSLPAIRHPFTSATQRVSKVWRSYAPLISPSKSKLKRSSASDSGSGSGISGVADSVVQSPSGSHRSMNFNVPDSQGPRGSKFHDSEKVVLHTTQYYVLVESGEGIV